MPSSKRRTRRDPGDFYIVQAAYSDGKITFEQSTDDLEHAKRILKRIRMPGSGVEGSQARIITRDGELVKKAGGVSRDRTHRAKKRTRRDPTPRKLRVTRVWINRQGYDKFGKYWGVGEKLFVVYSIDRGSDIYVYIRAKNGMKAKAEVVAELRRKGKL